MENYPWMLSSRNVTSHDPGPPVSVPANFLHERYPDNNKLQFYREQPLAFSGEAVNQQLKISLQNDSKVVGQRNSVSRVPFSELQLYQAAELPYYSVNQTAENRSLVKTSPPADMLDVKSQLFPEDVSSEKHLLVNFNTEDRKEINSVFLNDRKQSHKNAYETAENLILNTPISSSFTTQSMKRPLSKNPPTPVPPTQTPLVYQRQQEHQNNKTSIQSKQDNQKSELFSGSLHTTEKFIPEGHNIPVSSFGRSAVLDSRVVQSSSKRDGSFNELPHSGTFFSTKLTAAHAFLSQLPLLGDSAAFDDEEEEDSDVYERNDTISDDNEADESINEDSSEKIEISSNGKGDIIKDSGPHLCSAFAGMQEMKQKCNLSKNSMKNSSLCNKEDCLFHLNSSESPKVNISSFEKMNSFKEQLRACPPQLVDVPEMYPLITTMPSVISRPSVADAFSFQKPNVSSALVSSVNSCISSTTNPSRTFMHNSNCFSNSTPATFPKPTSKLSSTPFDIRREQTYMPSPFLGSLSKSTYKDNNTPYSKNLGQNSLNSAVSKGHLFLNTANTHSSVMTRGKRGLNFCNSTPMHEQNSSGSIPGAGFTDVSFCNSKRNSEKSPEMLSSVNNLPNKFPVVGLGNSCMTPLPEPVLSYNLSDSLHIDKNKGSQLLEEKEPNAVIDSKFKYYSRSTVDKHTPSGMLWNELVLTSSDVNKPGHKKFSGILNKGHSENLSKHNVTSDILGVHELCPSRAAVDNITTEVIPSVPINVQLDSQLQSLVGNGDETSLPAFSYGVEKIDGKTCLKKSVSEGGEFPTSQDNFLLLSNIPSSSKGARKPLTDIYSKESGVNQEHVQVRKSDNAHVKCGTSSPSSKQETSQSDDKMKNSVPLQSNNDKEIDERLSSNQNGASSNSSVQIPDNGAAVTDQEKLLKQEPVSAFTGSKSLCVNGRSYIILGVLGRGGSGKVYQVYDVEKNKILAVKHVSLNGVDETMKSGFINEIALLHKLQGSNHVIKLYDYESNNKELLVVLERGDTDLSSLLRSAAEMKKITPTMIKFYWSQMLEAVAEIHRAGIIHSDLKPSNFLLVAGQLKLIDFGIASAVQNDMTSVIKESQMGTVNFMSPEAIQDTCQNPQYNDKGIRMPQIKISVKSDVWSLGCILYNLVYGHTPFQHIPNIISKVNAIINSNYQIPFKDIDDPNLLNVLKSCLIRDPKKRPSIEQLLAHPYLTSEGNKDIAATPSHKNLRSVIHQAVPTLTPRRIDKIVQFVENLQ